MAIKNKLFLFVVTLILLGGNPMEAQKVRSAEESNLKAAFLYRFIDYIDWKTNPQKKTIKIAFLEDGPIAEGLLEISKNKNIEVKEYSSLDRIDLCDILYVPYNCTVPIETIISKYSGKPVLIVTERNGYAKKGAHLNFVIVDKKLKFEVNVKKIEKDGIGISSFLLQHAIIIR